MASSMSDSVSALRASLAGADYLCESPFGGTCLRVRFIGHFERQEVVWDAELQALAATKAETRQFIEIGTPGARGIPITIGLGVTYIDRPTLLKTLIMVRSYKRLRVGRHEFGRGHDHVRSNIASGVQ